MCSLDNQDSLLNASTLGQYQLTSFVKERILLEKPLVIEGKSLRESLKKNKSLTFASLYNVKVSNFSKDKHITTNLKQIELFYNDS